MTLQTGIHVSENEWQLATHCAYSEWEAKGPKDSAEIFLPQEGTLKTENSGEIAIGVANLQHSFIQIGGELYAIGNKEEGAFLGQGTSGEVFRARNFKGEEVAVKISKQGDAISNSEIAILKEVGYLRGRVAVGEKTYLVMALLNGQELMNAHKQLKVKHPWQSALLQVGLTEEAQKFFWRAINAAGGNVLDALEDEDFRPMVVRNFSKAAPSSDDPYQWAEQRLIEIEQQYRVLSEEKIYNKQQCLEFAISAAEELKKFFDKGYLHCDIKGQNFIGELVDGKAKAHLIDFGSALEISSPDQIVRKAVCVGSPVYMAPEVLSGMPAMAFREFGLNQFDYRAAPVEGAHLSQKSEVYSFAMMCQRDFGLESKAGFGLLAQALEMEPNDRPSMDALMFALGCEKLVRYGNSDEDIKALVESLQAGKYPESFDKEHQASFLENLVNETVHKMKACFQEDYLERCQVDKGREPTDLTQLSFREIIEQAESPHLFRSRKREVLKAHGWLDESFKRTGLAKTLLELEERQGNPLSNEQQQNYGV